MLMCWRLVEVGVIVRLPSGGRTLVAMVAVTLFLLLANIFVKLHSRRFLVITLCLILFFTKLPAHGLTLTLLPFTVFKVSCS